MLSARDARAHGCAATGVARRLLGATGMRTPAVLFLATLSLTGCLDGGASTDEEVAALAGTASSARPEIGRIVNDTQRCLGTLITPQVVITSSFCLDPAFPDNTLSIPPAGTVFQFTDKTGVARSYGVDRMHLFYRDFYDRVLDDQFGPSLAVVHLSAAVPAAQASPAGVSIRLPDDGTAVSVWGWDSTETAGKIVRSFTYLRGNGDAPFAWDLVDQGGPAVYGDAGFGGDLWGTVHRYHNHGGFEEDLFTPLPFYMKQVEELIHAWNGDDEVGVDRPGMDYASVVLGSAALCRARCDSEARCHAFSWVASGTRCWLKEGVPELRPGAGITSGRPVRNEVGFDRPGFDFASLSAPRADTCAVACARNASCRAWTWVSTSNTCFLKTPGTTRVANPSCTSGTLARLWETDVERPGFTYQTFTRADAIACAATCAGDARCRAYTYDNFTDLCDLKDTVPWAGHATAKVSGVRRGLEVDTNRSGSNYRSFSNPSQDPAECQAACARESQCQAWTYDGRSGQSPHCNLKNAVPARTAMTGAVSGLKGLEMM